MRSFASLRVFSVKEVTHTHAYKHTKPHTHVTSPPADTSWHRARKKMKAGGRKQGFWENKQRSNFFFVRLTLSPTPMWWKQWKCEPVEVFQQPPDYSFIAFTWFSQKQKCFYRILLFYCKYLIQKTIQIQDRRRKLKKITEDQSFETGRKSKVFAD